MCPAAPLVSSGSDFSTALAEHRRLFSKIYVNMIRAGESSVTRHKMFVEEPHASNFAEPIR